MKSINTIPNWFSKYLIFLSVSSITLFLPLHSFAQLSGTYTIGSGGNYTTFTEAANALHTQGVSGAVVFNVLPGSYTEQFTLDYVPYASETNSITFQSQSGDSTDVVLQYDAAGDIDNYLITLKRCSYVTLRGMTFQAVDKTYSRIITIEDYAEYLTIENCVFKGTYHTDALIAGAHIQSEDALLTHLKIYHNWFSRASYGIFCNSYNKNNLYPEIKYNRFDSTGYCAIFFLTTESPQISYNTINYSEYGIKISNATNATVIQSNKLTNISYFGMQLHGLHAAPGFVSYITNNMVAANLNGHIGIDIQSSEYMNILNNTILVNQDYYDCRALSIDYSTVSTINILNNNLVTLNNGYAIFVGHAGDVQACDYNNYYTPGRMFAYWYGGGKCEDFRTLKKVSKDNAHSVFAYPYFISDTNLCPRSAWLDGAGIPLSDNTEDLNGKTRDAIHPDIGAYEFTASLSVQPPLSGTKTVGNGGDYPTLNDAVFEAQVKGISDTLKLKIKSGTYDEHYIIPPIPGASSRHPIILESNSGNPDDVHLRYDAGSNEDNFIFKLIGSSFLHFKNLTVEGNGKSYCKVFDLKGLVDSLHIESCHINGSTQSDTNSNAILIYSEDYNLHGIFIENNIFSYGRTGILLNCPHHLSAPGTFYLENNQFLKMAYEPFYLSQVNSPFIVNNRMESRAYGIHIDNVNTGLKVENNYILAPYGRGIFINYNKLSQASPGLIDNNFVMCNYDFINEDALRLNSSDTIRVCFNSISVKNSNNNNYVPFDCYDSKGIGFTNNILSIQGTTYVVDVKNSTFSSADYNCYYNESSTLGYWDKPCSNLDSLRNASGMNEHSIFANPVFVSDKDLHVSSSDLDSAGIFINGIYFDYDGDPRDPQYPDIGADEFGTPPANHPPVAADDSVSVMSGQRKDILVLANDSDPDHESVHLIEVKSPVHGIAKVNADSTAVTYTANIDFTGPDSLKYLIADPRGAMDSAMIYIEVTKLIAFEHVPTTLDSISHGTGIWGDYDGDGDLDLLLAGIRTQNDEGTFKIYNNSGGTFTLQQTLANMTPGNASAAAWGDFDNDGDLDIVITGYETYPVRVTKIYQNNNGFFSVIEAGLPGVSTGSVSWGDYDNDGDLDLALSGYVGSNNSIANIYRNDGKGDGNSWNFTETNTLPGGSMSTMAWADYDGDGDLDILVSGNPAFNSSRLYQNNMGTFTQVYSDFASIAGQAAWYDYDNDGDPDILLTGYVASDYSYITKIFRNESTISNPVFVDIGTEIKGIKDGAVAWGDYDNDGDADICITGKDTSNTPVAMIYRNDGNDVFTETDINLPGVSFSSVSFGDYNRDGKLDVLLTGYQYDPDNDPLNNWNRYTGLFKNIIPSANTLPQAPQGLQYEVTNTSVQLSWHKAADHETPSAGLSYNLRIGTTPGGSEVKSAMANPDGSGMLAATGNAGQDTTWTLNHLQPGATYTWSVQAIDHAFAGSPFSSEGTFTTSAPYFSEVEVNLPGLTLGEVAWGDYDNDGDLDLAMTGRNDQPGFLTRIYRNNEGSFTDIEANLQAAEYSSLSWGDYDNDGDIDLLLFGDKRSGFIGKIYRNDGNDTFTDIQANLTPVYQGSAAWGDYDNDGDLDILVTGWDNNSVSMIFRNDSETFTDIATNLLDVYNSSVAWGDYDKDGDLDILLTGDHIGEQSDFVSIIYRNESGTFTEDQDIHLPGVRNGSVAWGDYDSDGYPDILLTGEMLGGPTTTQPVSKIFHNDQHGNFTDIHAALDSVYNSSVAWGDIDNDGDLDIILSGDRKIGLNNVPMLPVSEIYLNDNGIFTKVDRYLPGLEHGSVAVGDYDNDGGLDFVLTGADASQLPVCILLHNNNTNPNHAPDAPTGLFAYNLDSTLAFQWTYANDEETPQAGLSYNLRIGTTPGGSEIMSAMADPATGFRKVPRAGNVNQRNFWKISGLQYGKTYYWSVQAIDHSFHGSAFAAENSVTRMHVHNISGAIYTSNETPVTRATAFAYWKNEQGVATYNRYYALTGTNIYSFEQFPEGNITIRINPDATEYPDYLPTYLGNTSIYARADWLYFDNDTTGVDIYLVHKPVHLFGTAMIRGSLIMGQGKGKSTILVQEGKSTLAGDPVPDVWVYLLNNQGEIMAYDVTNDEGGFHFDSIPTGHYSFYADYNGWPMDAANDSLIIDQENHSYVISAVALETGITLTISDITTVNDQELEHGIMIFPNPVNDYLQIHFYSELSDDLKVNITGINGRIIKTIQLSGITKNSISRIQTHDLPSGIYLISITGKNCIFKARFVKIR